MRVRCVSTRRCIHRTPQTERNLPNLPDQCIEHIISYISPAQLVSFGWYGVAHGFSDLITYRLRKCPHYNVAEDGLFEFFRQTVNSEDLRNYPAHRGLLRLLMTKYFIYITDLTIPIGLFTHVKSLAESEEPSPSFGLKSLKKLTLQIGGEHGPLYIAKQHFDHLKAAKNLCGSQVLEDIHLRVAIHDGETVTCCGLREIGRFLLEQCDNYTQWNLTLLDATSAGQGWLGPTEITRLRNNAFVCYVRALLDLGVRINKLTLRDERKSSPYMMVQRSAKHRAVYLYSEYKNCRHLDIKYDIGLVAPSFAHEHDIFDQLETVSVDESHVLYKSDFLDFLKNASNLKEISVVLPATWTKRVSSCSKGCFSNPDYSCFRADGWCQVTTKLPDVHFRIV